MDLGIKGRVALVLGGGGGLGRAIAVALSGEGVHVALGDIDQAALDATLQAVENVGGKALALRWDAADLDAIDPSLQEIEARFGPVDILVNNTGGPPPTPAVGQPRTVWEQQFVLMVLSVIALTDKVGGGMRSRRWGRIITSASSGVVAPIPNLAISNALRLSLVGWSKTLSREVAADGVTVNVVVPGRIATARIRQLDVAKAAREGRAASDVAAESVGSIPIGRYGEPSEYAAMVAFLASERASYVTGSIMRVDGGLVASI